MQEQIDYVVTILEKLVNTPSPTGYTKQVQNLLINELEAMGLKPWSSNKGGVFCALNPGSKGQGIMLSAHIDTLGLIVRSIKSNGRLRTSTLGGYPLNYVEQETVKVWTRDGKSYEGTYRLNEPAVHGSREIGTLERSDTNMELVLDEEVFTEEETAKLGIQAGDPISLDPRFKRLKSGYIKSRHLDDKASSAILLALAKAFQDKTLTSNRPVYIMFTNYEEVGHGAAAAHPEGISDMIAVDMGVVASDLKTDERKVSICAKDSSGPYNYDLTSELIQVAKDNDLDYAVDVYPFYGSDAGAALSAGYDYRHALIGPGVAASHGYERTHEKGLANTYKLLESFLKNQ